MREDTEMTKNTKMTLLVLLAAALVIPLADLQAREAPSVIRVWDEHPLVGARVRVSAVNRTRYQVLGTVDRLDPDTLVVLERWIRGQHHRVAIPLAAIVKLELSSSGKQWSKDGAEIGAGTGAVAGVIIDAGIDDDNGGIEGTLIGGVVSALFGAVLGGSVGGAASGESWEEVPMYVVYESLKSRREPAPRVA